MPDIGDIISSIESAASDAIASAEQLAEKNIRVSLSTNLNAHDPVMLVTPPSPDDGSGAPSQGPSLVRILQPAVTVQTPVGTFNIAPMGVPTRDDGPVVYAGLALSAIALMGLGEVIKVPKILTILSAAGALVAVDYFFNRSLGGPK